MYNPVSVFKNSHLLKNVKNHYEEDLWKPLEDDLISAADNSCGWTKGTPKHKITWWWNKDVDQPIKQRRQLRKEWKKGGCK